MDLKRAQEDVSRMYDTKIEEVERNLLQLEQQLGIGLIQKHSQKTTLKQAQIDEEEQERPAQMRPQPIPAVRSQSQHLNQPIKQQRYKDLVGIQVDQPKQPKRAPEISEKWTEIFAAKPDLMQFYDSAEFNPVAFEKRDFKTAIHLDRQNAVFNETMDTFALAFL